MNSLVGMGVALVTPFKSDLSIDHEALTKVVEFNIENGTDYLVISGTTGESVTITKEEKKAIIQTIIKANAGRLPLVIGIGGNNTAAVIEELKTTDLSPFVAVLSVAPYYSKPTQEGLYQHFKAVAQASSKPIILYNVPGRTAKNMEPETSLRLARDFENIVAIKEAGNMVEGTSRIPVAVSGVVRESASLFSLSRLMCITRDSCDSISWLCWLNAP